MKIQTLIGLLKEHCAQNGNVDVFAHNSFGDIHRITGSTVLVGTRGKVEFEKLVLTAEESL